MMNSPICTQFKINWDSITPAEKRNIDMATERILDGMMNIRGAMDVREIDRLKSIIKKLEAENERPYLFLMGVESEVRSIVE